MPLLLLGFKSKAQYYTLYYNLEMHQQVTANHAVRMASEKNYQRIYEKQKEAYNEAKEKITEVVIIKNNLYASLFFRAQLAPCGDFSRQQSPELIHVDERIRIVTVDDQCNGTDSHIQFRRRDLNILEVVFLFLRKSPCDHSESHAIAQKRIDGFGLSQIMRLNISLDI